MRTSLVLSAYNGRDYIVEQLDSLRLQDRPLDEVLIGDDGSSDDTPVLVREYMARFQLDNWSIEENERNKGWRRNFHDLLRQVNGELIFLCDQDDVWLSEKVSEMSCLMESHPEIDVLACDVDPFYEEGSKAVPNVGKGANDGVFALHPLDGRAVYILRPGCAYCVRKSFLEEIEPYWDETWPHDAMLWELAQAKGTLALYDKRLVRFRRHEGNASARARMTRESRISDVEELLGRVRLMRRFGRDKGTLSEDDERLLDDLESWLKARMRLLGSKSIAGLIAAATGRSHYATWKGLLVDLSLALVRGMKC